jgi:O-methyltransferase involved in polyketide biosynthesis
MAAGFDTEQQTFFSWLGVVPYLTEPTVWSTLCFIAGLPNGAHVVFDYNNPPYSLSPKMRIAHDDRAVQVAKLGEDFTVYFETSKLHAQLRARGFDEIQDLGPSQIFSCFFPNFPSSIPENGGHILHATTMTNISIRGSIEMGRCNQEIATLTDSKT